MRPAWRGCRGGPAFSQTALGVAACERIIRTCLFTVAQLVVRLSDTYAGGPLEKTLASILKAELLILDEWGYVPIDKHGAQLLFEGESYRMKHTLMRQRH